MSKRWLVYTPEYGMIIPILDDGSGPTEYGSDVLYVRAANRQRAKVLAVRAWRRASRIREAHWIQDCDSDMRNPFAGLKVEPAEYSWRVGERPAP
jgi:hypothetical protein